MRAIVGWDRLQGYVLCLEEEPTLAVQALKKLEARIYPLQFKEGWIGRRAYDAWDSLYHYIISKEVPLGTVAINDGDARALAPEFYNRMERAGKREQEFKEYVD